MAALEKLSNTSWKQPFRDRKKELHLWGTHKEVADFCDLIDGEKRLLQITFESRYEIDVTDWFSITSGREISFTKEFQEFIKPIVFKNPDSFFVVRVADRACEGDYSATMQTSGSATVATRIGQARFRKDLINYWGGCAVTGTSLYEVLKASHIKPWSASSDKERLDHYNGLLLTPNIDALFDRGLITFSDSGEIMISNSILGHMNKLGIGNSIRLKKIEPQHKPYLKFHRENVFKKSN